MALLAAVVVAVFLVAPVFIVVPMSFSTAPSLQFPPPGYWLGYYRQYFTDPRWLYPTLNSFVIAAGTMGLTLALAVPAAFALVRHRFRGKTLAYLLLMSPMIIPLVVSALAYYSFLGRLRLTGTHVGVVLAHTALSVPIALLAITATLKGLDPNLERAAMSAGAGPIRAFWWVTFPVLRPGILVGALFAFLHSFDETVVALFIAGRAASTLPKKMFESIRLETDPVISVVSTLLFALVLVGSLIALLARSRGRRAA
ncbi:MAG TPA: ABC transporter permease [Candidatus Methylomirabilis sp.]|nr:ABC transporter permease [Candidatus Methylomirabilis sp.]